MLDPKLVNLSQARQQFKAPRSMRDVEANVALLPRLFHRADGTIKIKGVRTTISPLRQSQLVTTYGPGAMIDLPWFAAVLSGLDFWDKGVRISEPRLEAKAKAVLGMDSAELVTPLASDKVPDAYDEERGRRVEVSALVAYQGDEAIQRSGQTHLSNQDDGPFAVCGRAVRFL